jgi:tripeptidyl-peptidase I
VGGTSASSPTFAAVIALVNDALIAAGKPPLGFLNPWLYSGGYKSLTDVTEGSAYGCGTHGFPAQEGWDAVTGFGTPNFKQIVEAAMQQYGGWDEKGWSGN